MVASVVTFDKFALIKTETTRKTSACKLLRAARLHDQKKTSLAHMKITKQEQVLYIIMKKMTALLD
jgi:hypothetical protein